jgi:uncharacterized MAPEG superfamily protein
VTIDLWCLVGLTLWTLPLIFLPPVGKMRIHGVAFGVGNRDVEPEVPAWVKRAERASANHRENLPMFAVIVLVLHVTGKADDVSAAWSITYVIGRVLHSVLYWFGINKLALRSVAFYVALGALLMLVTRLA